MQGQLFLDFFLSFGNTFDFLFCTQKDRISKMRKFHTIISFKTAIVKNKYTLPYFKKEYIIETIYFKNIYLSAN